MLSSLADSISRLSISIRQLIFVFEKEAVLAPTHVPESTSHVLFMKDDNIRAIPEMVSHSSTESTMKVATRDDKVSTSTEWVEPESISPILVVAIHDGIVSASPEEVNHLPIGNTHEIDAVVTIQAAEIGTIVDETEVLMTVAPLVVDMENDLVDADTTTTEDPSWPIRNMDELQTVDTASTKTVARKRKKKL